MIRTLLFALLTCVTALVPTHAVAGATMKPGLIQAMADHDGSQPFGAIVHFRAAGIADRAQVLAAHGLSLSRDWTRYTDAVYATGPVSAFESLATDPAVYYIEENRRLSYFDETDTWATNVRAVSEAVSGGPYTVNGEAIDGSGVIVAVVDSGVNGKHADFGDRMVANYHNLCATPGLVNPPTGKCFANGVLGAVVPNDVVVVPVPNDQNSDITGGHGTHVAGIVLGDGTESTADYVDGVAPAVKGTYTGVAPGASLVAYGAGETLLIMTAAESFIHILDHYDEFPVKVINNSWGDGPADASSDGPAYDPADAISQLIGQLVDRGVVLTFASGNDGNNTPTLDRTSSYCKDPTPGVICVANYDDNARGQRDGKLNSSSSHGKLGVGNTYPDIAAPGTNITATCIQPEPGQAVCATGAESNWQPWYGTISGTSMAAPHVAGAVAMLFQVDPTLTPGEVELLLQRTARKVDTNGDYEPDAQQGAGGTHNWGFGAGLLDMKAALDALIADGSPGLVATNAALSGEQQVVADGGPELFVDAPAADIRSLSLEETVEGGKAGLRYRLGVADIDDLGGALSVGLRVWHMVSGRPVTIGFELDGTSVSAERVAPFSPVTTEAASFSVDGDVLSFFVSYGAMGGTEAGDAVHNVRVTSTNDFGDGLSKADFAPSVDGLTPHDTELSPMFGAPYAVTMSAAAEPPPPGPGTTTVHFAEQESGLATTPSLCFGCPTSDSEHGFGTHGFRYVLPEGDDYEALEVELSWSGEYNEYEFGVLTPGGEQIYSGFNLFPNGTVNSIQQGSSRVNGDPVATASRIIRIDNPVSGEYLATVKENVQVQGSFKVSFRTVCPDTGCGLVGVNTAPTASLAASATTIDAGQSVDFGVTMADAEGNALRYSLKVDGSEIATGTVSESVNHVFAAAGSYAVTLDVVETDTSPALSAPQQSETITVNAVGNDSDGDGVADDVDNCPDTSNADQDNFDEDSQGDACDLDDDNDGIEDTDENAGCQFDADPNCGVGGNGTLDAELTVSEDGDADDSKDADGPFTWTFDASASHYEEGGALNQPMFRFVFGDGSETPVQASAVVTHTYAAAGTYRAYAVVSDANGNAAISEERSISIQLTITVTDDGENAARLKVDKATGPAPLTVTFDAGSSTVAAGYHITGYAWDFDGDGGTDFQSSTAVVQHVYTSAGEFTPSVTVSYSNDDGSDTPTSVAKASVAATSPGSTPVQQSAGGGSLGWLVLLPLFGAGLARRRRS